MTDPRIPADSAFPLRPPLSSATSSPTASSVRRKPSAAGTFYPAEPTELAKTLSALFATVKRDFLSRPPLVLVAPHSALEKSGDVAAVAFSSLLGFQYDTVVVVGPSHGGFFPGASVYDGDYYVTPLGEIPIDKNCARELTTMNRAVYAGSKGHGGEGPRGEFSVETVLPFLQLAIGKFSLVAIVTGDSEISTARALGECLNTVLHERNALVVISSDLTHFRTPADTTKNDDLLRRILHEENSEKLINMFLARRIEACGMAGLIAGMIYAERIGTDERLDLAYRQSIVSAESEVIGHTAVVFTRGGVNAPVAPPAPSPDAFTQEDRDTLAQVARSAITAKFSGKAYELPSLASRAVSGPRGVFVTIYRGQEILGRAGYLRSREGLMSATRDAAVAAFFESRQFDTVGLTQIPEDVTILVSVISPLRRIHELNDLDFQCDGLMVKLELASAFMFPDEFPPEITTVEEALEAVCLKAQLPKGAYRDKIAEIYSFTLFPC